MRLVLFVFLSCFLLSAQINIVKAPFGPSNVRDSFSSATTKTITHNLNTVETLIQCYTSSDVPIAITSVSRTTNTTTANFATNTGYCIVNGTGGPGPAGATGPTGPSGTLGGSCATTGGVFYQSGVVNEATCSAAFTWVQNSTGLTIATRAVTGSPGTTYGLSVSPATGGSLNYAAIFNGDFLGVGNLTLTGVSSTYFAPFFTASKTFTATLGTLTGSSTPAFSSTATWNNAATTFVHQFVNVTDTASAAGSLLADWRVGGVSRFSLSKAGFLTVSSNISGDALNARSGFLQFGSLGNVIASSDGVWALRNNAGSDFSRLQFGGTTSSFPSWKRNGAAMESRLADNSATGVTITKLPTSCSGLEAGTLYNNAGTPAICP